MGDRVRKWQRGLGGLLALCPDRCDPHTASCVRPLSPLTPAFPTFKLILTLMP